MSSTSTELASIEAQLALQRAALADKIFARFDQSSSSKKDATASKFSSSSSPSLTKKKKNNGQSEDQKPSTSSSLPFEHRPPTLGLGATAQTNREGANGQRPTFSRHLTQEDARLRGRLVNRQKGEAGGKGKRKAVADAQVEEEEGEEEEESKATRLTKAGKAKVDPFAVKPPKASKKKSTPLKSDQEQISGQQSTSTAVDDSSASHLGVEVKLSKSQRKKLNKKRKVEQESQSQHASEDISVPTSSHEVVSSKKTSGNVVSPTSSTSQHRLSDADNTLSGEVDEKARAALVGSSSYRSSATLPSASSTQASSPTLSLHQQTLHSKIQGSHFRQLNESLYTSESAESFRLAQEDPSRMQSYHEGFREQVKKWPQKPFEIIGDVIVDEMVASWCQLTSSGSSKGSGVGKVGRGTVRSVVVGSIPPGALIADLGAGEGPLSKYLSAHPKLLASKSSFPTSLLPKVLAYDLLDTADGIVRGADCAQLGGVPLPGRTGGGVRERLSRLEESSSQSVDRGVVDVVVFCLSLMGTDWVGMILEARRILKNGGQILIAEVTSRFVDPSTQAFTNVIERLGFKQIGKETERVEGKKENSHFVLLRYAKLLDEEILANAEKGERGKVNGLSHGASSSSSARKEGEDSRGGSRMVEARELDEEEERRLRSEGQKVLKPCLYKRR